MYFGVLDFQGQFSPLSGEFIPVFSGLIKHRRVQSASLSFLALFHKLVQDLLKTLPQMFTKTLETQSALGPALQAAFKLMSPTGGRMSVFQTQLPTLGVGALKPREEPNQRSSAKVRKSSSV